MADLAAAKADLEELLKFLPFLEDTDPSDFVHCWHEGLAGENEYISPYPEYVPEVDELVGVIYRFLEASQATHFYRLADQNIETASIEECCEMLAKFVRGERFCDGYQEDELASRKIPKILRRLKQLSD